MELYFVLTVFYHFRCELYEKTNTEYRELENIMAWLSTLGGAFSSLGDQTEHCVNIQYFLN